MEVELVIVAGQTVRETIIIVGHSTADCTNIANNNKKVVQINPINLWYTLNQRQSLYMHFKWCT